MATAFGLTNWRRWRVDEVDEFPLFWCAQFAVGVLNLYLDIKIWHLPQELFCVIGWREGYSGDQNYTWCHLQRASWEKFCCSQEQVIGFLAVSCTQITQKGFVCRLLLFLSLSCWDDFGMNSLGHWYHFDPSCPCTNLGIGCVCIPCSLLFIVMYIKQGTGNKNALWYFWNWSLCCSQKWIGFWNYFSKKPNKPQIECRQIISSELIGAGEHEVDGFLISQTFNSQCVYSPSKQSVALQKVHHGNSVSRWQTQISVLKPLRKLLRIL